MLFSQIDTERAVDLAFNLFKTLDAKKKITSSGKNKIVHPVTEFELFKSPLRQTILRYSNQNYTKCREKLYNALADPYFDKIVRDELLDLWAFTSPGFEKISTNANEAKKECNKILPISKISNETS